MSAPLFLLYRSRVGNPYILDSATGEIIRVSNDMYEIAGDYQVLDTDELATKYGYLGRARINRAVDNFRNLQEEGLLPSHAPTITLKPDILLHPEPGPLAAFLSRNRRLLTLEVTRACNLKCAYCPIGGLSTTARPMGAAKMSWEIAQKAVSSFLDCRHQKRPTICFYGGEPLLAFGLVRRIISWAETYASDHDLMQPKFSLTTNGTLLTDDAIHYLVSKNVTVAISLDGDEASHDRYRVFAGRPKLGSVGSFSSVTKNVERFIELYPKYTNRSLQATITSSNHIEQTDALFSSYVPYFAGITANFVGGDDGFARATFPYIQYGPTPDQPDGRNRHIHGDPAGSSVANGGHVPDVPDYRNWTRDRRERLDVLCDNFVEELVQNPATAISAHPILYSLILGGVKSIHLRPVSRRGVTRHISYRCMPAATRLFCSVEGVYYPCERTECSGLTVLGNVDQELNGDRAVSVGSMPFDWADCNNCVIAGLCSLCPAAVHQDGSGIAVNAHRLQRACAIMKDEVVASLITYTSIMERNPLVFEGLFRDLDHEPSWMKTLQFVRPADPLSAEEIGIERLPASPSV